MIKEQVRHSSPEGNPAAGRKQAFFAPGQGLKQPEDPFFTKKPQDAFFGKNQVVQRQILHGPNMAILERNPIETPPMRMDQELGFTPPCINDLEINDQSKPANIEGVLDEPDVQFILNPDTNKYRIEAKPPVNEVGFTMYLPVVGPWIKAQVKKEDYGPSYGIPPADMKTNEGKMSLEITGIPDHNALSRQVEKHELHHAQDNTRIGTQLLNNWETLPKSIQEYHSPEIASKAYRELGIPNKKVMANELFTQWEAASTNYHNSEEGKVITDYDNSKYDPNTNKLTIVIRLTQP
jgi:hypothetical protein